MAYDQNNLINKIIKYLELELKAAPALEVEGRRKIIEEFRNARGYCAGLNILWSYSRLIADEKTDKSKAVDDINFFQRVLENLTTWDEKTPFDSAEKDEIERFISHVIFFQSPRSFVSSLAQNNFLENAEDTKGRKFNPTTPERTVLCSKEMLSRILEASLAQKRVVNFACNEHVASVYKSAADGKIYFYDSVNPKGEVSFDNIDDLAKALWESSKKEPPMINGFPGISIKDRTRDEHFRTFAISSYSLDDTKSDIPTDITVAEFRQIFSDGFPFAVAAVFEDEPDTIHQDLRHDVRKIFSKLTESQIGEILGKRNPSAVPPVRVGRLRRMGRAVGRFFGIKRVTPTNDAQQTENSPVSDDVKKALIISLLQERKEIAASLKDTIKEYAHLFEAGWLKDKLMAVEFEIDWSKAIGGRWDDSERIFSNDLILKIALAVPGEEVFPDENSELRYAMSVGLPGHYRWEDHIDTSYESDNIKRVAILQLLQSPKKPWRCLDKIKNGQKLFEGELKAWVENRVKDLEKEGVLLKDDLIERLRDKANPMPGEDAKECVELARFMSLDEVFLVASFIKDPICNEHDIYTLLEGALKSPDKTYSDSGEESLRMLLLNASDDKKWSNYHDKEMFVKNVLQICERHFGILPSMQTMLEVALKYGEKFAKNCFADHPDIDKLANVKTALEEDQDLLREVKNGQVSDKKGKMSEIFSRCGVAEQRLQKDTVPNATFNRPSSVRSRYTEVKSY